jgi:hypothetical protein
VSIDPMEMAMDDHNIGDSAEVEAAAAQAQPANGDFGCEFVGQKFPVALRDAKTRMGEETAAADVEEQLRVSGEQFGREGAWLPLGIRNAKNVPDALRDIAERQAMFRHGAPPTSLSESNTTGSRRPNSLRAATGAESTVAVVPRLAGEVHVCRNQQGIGRTVFVNERARPLVVIGQTRPRVLAWDGSDHKL